MDRRHKKDSSPPFFKNIPHQASVSDSTGTSSGSSAGAPERSSSGSGAGTTGAGIRLVLASELQVGMVLYIHRPVKPNGELGKKLLDRMNITEEELIKFRGRSLLWRVREVVAFTWGQDLPGYDPCPAYRITFVSTSIASVYRVEEYFPNNEVGTCL